MIKINYLSSEAHSNLLACNYGRFIDKEWFIDTDKTWAVIFSNKIHLTAYPLNDNQTFIRIGDYFNAFDLYATDFSSIEII